MVQLGTFTPPRRIKKNIICQIVVCRNIVKLTANEQHCRHRNADLSLSEILLHIAYSPLSVEQSIYFHSEILLFASVFQCYSRP